MNIAVRYEGYADLCKPLQRTGGIRLLLSLLYGSGPGSNQLFLLRMDLFS
jgi:hypothetical protein